jgi:hypothetical protein
MISKLFSLFTRRSTQPPLTQDQGAEALGAFLVISAAQSANDYLKTDVEVLAIPPDITITQDKMFQIVLEFLMVQAFYVNSYIATNYCSKIKDPSYFFKVMDAITCREYMKPLRQTDSAFTVDKFSAIWREAFETYASASAFFSDNPGAQDSVAGQFAARLGALLGFSRYSMAAANANIHLAAFASSERDNKIIDTICSRIVWK